MKIFAILIFLFATALPSQTLGQAMDFSLHITFIKCYAQHWKGSSTEKLPGFENELKLTCDGFWGKFAEQSKNPEKSDTESSPFQLLVPNSTPVDIPFSVWSGYLDHVLDISDDNPLRKSK